MRPVPTASHRSRRHSTKIAPAILIAAFLAILLGQTGGRAAVDPYPLKYASGFLVTGDYVVAGVDLTPQLNPPDANGLATGTITVPANAVPYNADIVGAYLYWESIFVPVCLQTDPATGNCVEWQNPADGAKFNGLPISPTARKATSFALSGNLAACWGAAGATGSVVTEFRADVLPLLPKRFDTNNQWTGKYNVNTSHTVTLPEKSGDHAIQSAGATLFLVYRDPSQPLRKIVVFEGAYAQPDAAGVTLAQNLSGFYKSASAKSAKLTHIVGSGGNNMKESVAFNGTVVSAGDPFPQTSPSSDRSWANPTFVVSQLMPGGNFNDGHGESATTTIQVSNASPAACRVSSAVIFSTAVADVDGDGLPDGLEDAANGLNDPPTSSAAAGDALPNLNQMGASSSHKDLFIELNAMYAVPGTTYGSFPDAPISATTPTLTDTAGHNHLPTPDVLKMVADVYAAHSITPHFDVGDPAAYHSKPGYQCDPALSDCNVDPYLVPAPYARGGEQIKEAACGGADDSSSLNCQFYAFPGSVGWKVGLQLYRDAPVDDLGQELTPAQIADSWQNGTHRRRFDRVRHDYFHYMLLAHTRGRAKSPFPCLDANNNPTSYTGGACAVKPNPDYHVPVSGSGIADQPGSNVLITLGLWDNFLGTPFVQASTMLHETGHNLGLWHGGLEAIWGDKATNTATYFEPNCKPNYFSSMSYLYQVHGLVDADGNVHLDYSHSAQDPLNESSLADAPLGPSVPLYVPTWYAPASSPLALSQNATAAKRFCNGSLFDPLAKPADMARVHADSPSSSVDWNGDGVTNGAAPLNVNFDGTGTGASVISSSLNGFDDWSNIRLDQIGAGRHEKKYSDGDFVDLGSGDYIDLGTGDFVDLGSGDFVDLGSGDFLDLGSGDYIDLGSGDFIDIGSGDFIDIGSGDFIDIGSGDFIDIGSGDFLDLGSGDFLDLGSGTDVRELDYDAARAIGRSSPGHVTACVIGTAGCTAAAPGDPLYHRIALQFRAPTFGHVAQYHISRKKDGTGNSYQEIGTSQTLTFVDSQELPQGVTFAYTVRAEFDDSNPHDFSPASTAAKVTAIDDAPSVANDSYNANAGMTLTISAAAGVLANDADDDTPKASVQAVVATPPAHGALALNANGAFTYTAVTGYSGVDTFTYVANDGLWSGDGTTPLSANSSPATVTITVNAVPVANNDNYGTQPNTPLNIAAPGVLSNDVDADGNALTVALKTAPSHAASFTLNANGSFAYTPAPNFIGIDQFTYTATDGKVASDGGLSVSNVATVSINVDTNPSCQAQAPTQVITGGSKVITLLPGACADPDPGQTLTIVSVTQPAHGTVTFTATTATYTSTAPYVGPDSFRFTVSDGNGGAAQGTANVNVIYGFTNVQNLPSSGNKTFNSGSTVPLAWQWTNAAGTALDSTAGQPEAFAYACTTNGVLPPALQIGDFTPSNPGLGNSYQPPTLANGWTWQFNWKLTYKAANGTIVNLPSGTYVVRMKSGLTGQVNPSTTNVCDGGVQVVGALVRVK